MLVTEVAKSSQAGALDKLEALFGAMYEVGPFGVRVEPTRLQHLLQLVCLLFSKCN